MIPWERDGCTHFISFAGPFSSRKRAITESVIEWAYKVDTQPPTGDPRKLETEFRKQRLSIWAKLRRQGFRVERVKITVCPGGKP